MRTAVNVDHHDAPNHGPHGSLRQRALRSLVGEKGL